MKISLLKEFSFIYDIVKAMCKKEKIKLDEIRAMGGRGSGKTTNVAYIFFALLAYYLPEHISMSFIGFRAAKQNLHKMIADAKNFYNSAGIDFNYISNAETKAIEINGRLLRFDCVNSKKTEDNSVMSGYPVQKVDYLIVWLEECYEFSMTQISSFKQSVRGDNKTHRLELFTNNPWSPSNPYVMDTLKLFPFNINKMKEVGWDCKVTSYWTDILGKKEETRVLVHYSNWRINRENLSLNFIQGLLSEWRINPAKARTADWGVPGYETGQIYTHCLDKIGKAVVDNSAMWILAGMDYGWGRTSRAGKTVCYFGTGSIQNGIDLLDEYVQDNSTVPKDPNLVVKEVVQFYINSMRRYCEIVQKTINLQPYNITIRVDNAAVGVITMLNNEALNRGVNKWMRFISCVKHPINDRIEITLALMSKGMLRVSENVKLLLQEMDASYYEDTINQKRANVNDHALNAFEYAIENVMYQFAQNATINTSSKFLKKMKVF